ncbi:MAG: hypothetical protein LBF92_09080 [Synergistaceae bacterium]|jgi:hypothetical protein|nr:hypothetical protein [Synergistaceae bacterium]
MLAKRSFTLAELVVTCSVVALLCGCVTLAASPVIAVFLDESRERAVEREVLEAVSWIKGHLHAARALRRDVTLKMYANVEPTLSFRCYGDYKDDEMYSELIGFQASSSSMWAKRFTYSHQFQTMSPAIEIRIYKLTDHGYKITDWVVKISGRGLVTPEKHPVAGS